MRHETKPGTTGHQRGQILFIWLAAVYFAIAAYGSYRSKQDCTAAVAEEKVEYTVEKSNGQ